MTYMISDLIEGEIFYCSGGKRVHVGTLPTTEEDNRIAIEKLELLLNENVVDKE